nr:phage terminase small subunit P27 family [Bacillus velezensis]
MTEVLLETPITALVEDDDGNKFEVANKTYSDLLINQDKLFKQCRQASSDLGLTISSRCKLVIPKKMMGNRSQKRKNGSVACNARDYSRNSH